MVLDADGNIASTRIAIGRLGSPATTTLSIPGYAESEPAGGFVLVLVEGVSGSTIDVYRASDGSRVSEIDPGGFADAPHVAVDPEHEVIYAGVRPAAGGVDIRRIALDGSGSESLIGLDDRFAAQAMPIDHTDSSSRPTAASSSRPARTTNAACGGSRPGRPRASRRACRPARPRSATSLGRPMTGSSLRTRRCATLDVAEAPFPWRSIALGDGASRLLTDRSQVGIARVLRSAARRSPSPVVDPAVGPRPTSRRTRSPSGKRHVIVEGLDNDADADAYGGWLGVSSQVMPGAWVLVEPWGIETTGAASLTSRLVNVRTGEVIELPLGTSGWS